MGRGHFLSTSCDAVLIAWSRGREVEKDSQHRVESAVLRLSATFEISGTSISSIRCKTTLRNETDVARCLGRSG